MGERFRITQESRGEDLETWKPEELRTLRARLEGEIEENQAVVAYIDELLGGDLREEALGDRPELPPLEV